MWKSWKSILLEMLRPCVAFPCLLDWIYAFTFLTVVSFPMVVHSHVSIETVGLYRFKRGFIKVETLGLNASLCCQRHHNLMKANA